MFSQLRISAPLTQIPRGIPTAHSTGFGDPRPSLPKIQPRVHCVAISKAVSLSFFSLPCILTCDVSHNLRRHASNPNWIQRKGHLSTLIVATSPLYESSQVWRLRSHGSGFHQNRHSRGLAPAVHVQADPSRELKMTLNLSTVYLFLFLSRIACLCWVRCVPNDKERDSSYLFSRIFRFVPQRITFEM